MTTNRLIYLLANHLAYQRSAVSFQTPSYRRHFHVKSPKKTVDGIYDKMEEEVGRDRFRVLNVGSIRGGA